MPAPVFATGDVPTASQVNDWFVNTKFVRKTANLSRSSTATLADDSDLVMTVPANSVFHVTVCLRHQSGSTGDFQWQFLGPSGSSFDHIAQTITAGGSAFIDDNNFGQDLATPSTSGGIVGNKVPIFVEGLLVTAGTPGSFKLQWAQAVSNATSSTLLANSFMLLRLES